MLHINPIDMVCLAINLLVLFLFLKKFLFKPVTAMIESRQQEIEDNLSQAERERAEAAAMQAEVLAQMQSAHAEAASIVAQGKSRGDAEYHRALAEAQKDTSLMAQRTRALLEAERTEMIHGVKKEVSALALLAAAQVSGHAFSADEDEQLVSAFLSEVSGENE